MLKGMGILAAMFISGPTHPEKAPIHLVAERVGEAVSVKVIGAPGEDFEGRFTLDVAANGNQSRHGGSARLRKGEVALLSTVTVSVPAGSEWKARLVVDPRAGQSYEEVRTSGD